jgi:hypothetical protein
MVTLSLRQTGDTFTTLRQPAEATNHDHPTKLVKRQTVPGAGIVSGGSDAGPKQSGPADLHDVPYPGSAGGADACTPGVALNALHPGTDAPLAPPNEQTEPQGSSESLAPELADPNFPRKEQEPRLIEEVQKTRKLRHGGGA